MVKEWNFISPGSIFYCATAFINPNGKKRFCNFVMQKKFRKSSPLLCVDALGRSKKIIKIDELLLPVNLNINMSFQIKGMSLIQHRRLEIGDYLSWPVGSCYQIIADQCKNLLFTFCILLQFVQVDLHLHWMGSLGNKGHV